MACRIATDNKARAAVAVGSACRIGSDRDRDHGNGLSN